MVESEVFFHVYSRREEHSIRPAADIPAAFVAFDILYLNGEDITHLPLERA